MPPPAEPCIKRYNFAAFHQVVREMWGEEGLADVRSRMPPREAEEAFADSLPPWVPERVVIAWCFALWEGRADRKRARYVAWLHRVSDVTFGRVRRLLLSIATPAKIFGMAGELWRSDRTHGTLAGTVDGKRGVFVLSDHPYNETPQARATMAELLRYTIELTRAKNVTETHARRIDGALEVKVKWL